MISIVNVIAAATIAVLVTIVAAIVIYVPPVARDIWTLDIIGAIVGSGLLLIAILIVAITPKLFVWKVTRK